MRLRKSYTEKNKTTMSCFELMPFKTQLSNTIKGTIIVCSVRSVSSSVLLLLRCVTLNIKNH